MNKKEYSIKINGVDVSIKDVTKLEDAVKSLDKTIATTNTNVNTSTKASTTKTKALTEEERASKKLEATQKRITEVNSEANRTQIEANQQLREHTREVTRQVQINQLAEGSIKAMGMQLTDLRNEYEGLSKSERENAEVGSKLLEQIQALDAEYKSLRENQGNFRDSVGNYAKANNSLFGSLQTLQKGLEGTKDAGDSISETFKSGSGILDMFGVKSSDLSKEQATLQKILGLVELAQMNLSKALKGSTGATNTASLATKGFSLALKTIGIGLIIAAIAYLTDKWEDLTKEVNKFLPAGQSVEKIFNKIKAIALGVGNAIVSYVITPFKALSKVIQGDFKGALAEVGKGYNFLGNFNKGYNDTIAKQNKEARQKEEQADIDNQKRELQRKKNRGENTEKQEIALQKKQIELLKKHGKETKEAQVELEDLQDKAVAEQKRKSEQAAKQAADLAKKRAKEAEEARKREIELQKEKQQIELGLIRQSEDVKTELIVDEYDKRMIQINDKYTREREDLKKRLIEDQKLTQKAKEAITSMLLDLELQEINELKKIQEERLGALEETKKKEAELSRKYTELELNGVELAYQQSVNRLGEITKKSKNGLIDVEETKKNLNATNSALAEYIGGLESYLISLKNTHEKTLATLEVGSPQYEEELQKYAKSVLDAEKKITSAEGQMTENTERSKNLQLEYWKEVTEKIAGYAEIAVQAISTVTDMLGQGLQAQMEGLNEQLEAINEKYEQAQKIREKAVENVKKLEEEIQNATGGTAEVLKSQLQDTMNARDEAAREEQRLAKEKQQLEKEIAKKEKQQKRIDLITQIAQGTANVAQGITKALSLGPIMGPIMAALVGGLGAVQISVMTKQLTKLEKGGEITGPSHANGGIKVSGTDIEVEGGEFVVNKKSYGSNEDLIKFINASPGTVTASDLMGLVPGIDNTPVIVTDTNQTSEDRIVEAIENIEMHPAVAVTDILDVTNDVVTVRDLSGF